MAIIEVKNLGKKYKKYNTKWHRIADWIIKNKQWHQELWVLRGISFSVNEGEAVGIIGQNGAGKSTLLKILTGTTKPTEGSYKIKGRVAAILELGMGFHPDFTGRQNAYMTGQLLGIDNETIARLMPSIEEFAEIGEYIDQPLRTYSSGMIVRLAFSVVTAVRPDILIVDEALSVGDAYFQHKCFERIRKFREAGTTLLFVSHDPGAVKSLCDRAILLDKGLLVKEGIPEEILDYYNAVIAARDADYKIQQSRSNSIGTVTRSGDNAIKIRKVKIQKGERNVNAIQVGDQINIIVEINIKKVVNDPTIGILFKDRLGNHIFGTNTYYLGLRIGKCSAGQTKKIVFSLPASFGVGHYSLTVAAHEGYSHLQGNHDWWDHAATLQVIPGKEDGFTGVCYIKTKARLI